MDYEDVIFEEVRFYFIKLYVLIKLEFDRLKLSLDRGICCGVYRYYLELSKDFFYYVVFVDGELGLEEMLWNKFVFRD